MSDTKIIRRIAVIGTGVIGASWSAAHQTCDDSRRAHSRS